MITSLCHFSILKSITDEDYIFPCDASLAVAIVFYLSCCYFIAVVGKQFGISYGFCKVFFGVEDYGIGF